MSDEVENSCETQICRHRVNVFHIDTSYRFFTLGCDGCKQQPNCGDEKHKSEICKLAICATRLLMSFTRGSVISFKTHDFYIGPLKNRYTKQQFYIVLARLRKKFLLKSASICQKTN